MRQPAGADARRDAGAGAAVAIAVLAVVALVATAAVALGAGLAVRQRVVAAADAAALAAADAAAGAVAGDPCPTAGRVAEADGAQLLSCTADGLVLTVAVAASVAGVPLTARATAGPPR
ncbi:Rv3654c family TadE-like protein [Pseudolysinimonas sp.]|uniref:Rv3654c family TadE-like protein n=1 Tax=Pseudolysinimonas sp. TaxID=2680009 RepID=UPI003F7D8F7F